MLSLVGWGPLVRRQAGKAQRQAGSAQQSLIAASSGCCSVTSRAGSACCVAQWRFLTV